VGLAAGRDIESFALGDLDAVVASQQLLLEQARPARRWNCCSMGAIEVAPLQNHAS